MKKQEELRCRLEEAGWRELLKPKYRFLKASELPETELTNHYCFDWRMDINFISKDDESAEEIKQKLRNAIENIMKSSKLLQEAKMYIYWSKIEEEQRLQIVKSKN